MVHLTLSLLLYGGPGGASAGGDLFAAFMNRVNHPPPSGFALDWPVHYRSGTGGSGSHSGGGSSSASSGPLGFNCIRL